MSSRSASAVSAACVPPDSRQCQSDRAKGPEADKPGNSDSTHARTHARTHALTLAPRHSQTKLGGERTHRQNVPRAHIWSSCLGPTHSGPGRFLSNPNRRGKVHTWAAESSVVSALTSSAAATTAALAASIAWRSASSTWPSSSASLITCVPQLGYCTTYGNWQPPLFLHSSKVALQHSHLAPPLGTVAV